MSLRYISTGSAPPFSPTPKAADGVAGVRIALTPLAKAVLEILLDQGADLLRAQIIGVVIAGGEHIGADHDAAAHFVAKAFGAGVLVQFADRAAGHAQAVAHAVVAREVGRGFRRRHDVIGRQRVFGVRQRHLDQFGAGRLQPRRALGPELFDFRRHAVEAVLLRECRSSCP